MKTVIDLFCGLGGWAHGFIDAGYRVIGYDIEDFSADYPGRFVRADLLKCDDFPNADIVLASPPCTDFTKMGLPSTWPAVRKFPPNVQNGIALFRRAEEIIRKIDPEYWVIENVNTAQRYVGKARMHYGSRYLWGNFPDFIFLMTGDQYGKWKLPPTKNRPALRSVIPYSLSRSLAEVME